MLKIDGIRISTNWNDIAGVATEPTNHPTNFIASSNSSTSIPLAWTDATGGQLPQNYLIKAAIAPATPTGPVDGTPEANGALVQNVAYGAQEFTFSGLTPNTSYNFSIWPYTNTGTAIDYKTGGALPTASATTLSTATGYFRSNASGNWGTFSTWEFSADGSTGWATATAEPLITDNVSVLNTHSIIVDGTSKNCRDLTIESGAVLTIDPGKSLTVNGILTNAANSGLVINSDNTGTGSLKHNNANVPATIKRYITGSSTITNMMYHYVSVPLTFGGTSNQFLGSYLFDFNVAGNQWNALGSSSATALDNKTGYMIYYPGTSTTYQFTGALNNGTFSPNTINAGSGFNLVPNPYPSALDWNAAEGWTKTNIAGSIYFWPAGRPANNTNYAVWNGTFGTNSGTQYIPVGQAFFVQSVAAAPVLSMTNATRVHNAQAFWKSSDALSNLLRIKSVSLNNNAFDEMIVNFREDATTGFDSQFDANKLQGGENAPQLNSVASDDVRLAINTLPFSTSDVIVPLNFALNASSDVTFTASGLDSFYESISIYLEDKELNTLTDLRTQPVYTFSHNTGSGDNRFQLRFKGVTGTNELPETIQGSVFVSQGSLFVDVPAMQQSTATIGIFDALGRQISTRKVVINGIVKLEAPVAAGMYIVRVLSGNQTFTGKVIVK